MIIASKRLRELKLIARILEISRVYWRNELDNAVWTLSDQNIADNLTQAKGSSTVKSILETGCLHFIIEQCTCKKACGKEFDKGQDKNQEEKKASMK